MTITGRRGFDINHPHGSIYYGIGDSALNAAPYALTGEPATNPATCRTVSAVRSADLSIFRRSITVAPRPFSSSTTTASVGRIPSTSFPLCPRCWSGREISRRRPTRQERAGTPVKIFDPATNTPFPNNTIPQINPVAAALLPYIPQPNLPGNFQNFHFVTSATSDSDDLNVRMNHTFGAAPTGGRRRRRTRRSAQ